MRYKDNEDKGKKMEEKVRRFHQKDEDEVKQMK